jgi:hypothetical protein
MRLVIFAFLVGCAGAHGSAQQEDDAPPTDGMTSDDMPGGEHPPPVTCGGQMCQSGQACVDNTCTFACSGATVPGDYATIQTAIDALAAAGQDATICLGEATFNESYVYVRDQGTHNKTLRIIGLSSDRSIINGQVYVNTGWTKVHIEGVQIRTTSSGSAALYAQGAPTSSLEVVGTKLSASYHGIEAYQKQSILIDGCEIAVSNGYGISLFANNNGPLAVRVQNSYLHGGYSLRATGSGFEVQLTFVNNLVKGSDVGADISGSTTALIANNIFSNITDTALQWSSTAIVDRHHNALFANTTNYGGIASDGPNTLKADCMLGTGTIPALGAGSPCRDAGDHAVAPMLDFYGATRAAMPDLGPVDN